MNDSEASKMFEDYRLGLEKVKLRVESNKKEGNESDLKVNTGN